jgi:hypothetical protein
MERLGQGHLQPKLEVARLTYPGRESNPGSTVGGENVFKKHNNDSTCAGLWIYGVYITHFSLGMITRSCSTLYSQWQYLIYTTLRCAYSDNV